jgi:hypothetical protein
LSTEPDYFCWPFVFLITTSQDEMEEAEYWKKWLEQWQPKQEWLQ